MAIQPVVESEAVSLDVGDKVVDPGFGQAHSANRVLRGHLCVDGSKSAGSGLRALPDSPGRRTRES